MRIPSLVLIAALGAASCADSVAPVVSGPGTPADPIGGQWGSGGIPPWLQPAPTSQDYGPYQIQLSNSTLAYLSRVALPAEQMPLFVPGVGGTVLNLSLFVESTQALEYFSVFVPDSPAGQLRPLLTAFHGYGTSHLDIVFRTQFFQEAAQRDWFLIAPLQRNLSDPMGDHSDINYASAQSQLHVEAVIQFMLENYAIDLDRLYGVGFSMGGGSALSYAARHRDRDRGAFAAVVNHTGTVALSDEYLNLPAGSPVIDIMDQIFGGRPSASPFEWQRSSLIELDDFGLLRADGRHMAQNLVSVPVQTWFNASDQLAHLPNQQQKLDQYLQGIVGADHSLTVVPGGVSTCGSNQHCWDTLDQTMACDWLEQQSLNSHPLAGTLLVDRSGEWEYFDLEQALVDEFSSLEYSVDPLGSSFSLFAPQNLGEIRTSLGELGLDPLAGVELRLEGFGFSDCPIVLTGVLSAPITITREGVLLTEDCSGLLSSPTWCYDPSEETLTLREVDPALKTWRLQF